MKYLDPQQRKRLVKHCRAKAGDGRNRHTATSWMMIHLGIGAGLSVGELTNLRVSDCRIDAKPTAIHVRCVDSRRAPGDVIIGQDLCEHLRRFLAQKAAWGHDVSVDACVLTADSGKHYTVGALQKGIKAVGDAAGLPYMSGRCLRNTFFRELLRQTMNLWLVQKQSRSRNPVRRLFYTEMQDVEIQAAMDLIG